MYVLLMTIFSAWAGICGLFEKKLRESQPTQRVLSYDVEQLYNFLDDMVMGRGSMMLCYLLADF